MRKYVPDPADIATIYSGPTRVWIADPSIVNPHESFNLRVSLLRSDEYFRLVKK